MIRSTVNATIKTIKEDATKIESGLKELCYGSLDGIVADTNHEFTVKEWETNWNINAGSTVSPVPSDVHWDGVTAFP